MKTLLARIGLAIVAFIAALLIAAVIGVELDLASQRPRLEALASDALGRPVEFDGRLVLEVGTRPAIDAEEITIANPPEWNAGAEAAGDETVVRRLVSLERARIELSLVPLLFRRLVVQESSAEGAEIQLRVDRAGRENWDFGDDRAEEADESERTDAPFGAEWLKRDLFIDSAALEKLSLRDVRLSFRDERRGETRRYELDELTASAATDEPLVLELRGSIRGVPIHSTLRTGDPDALLAGRAFGVEIETELAGTDIRMGATVDANELSFADAVGLLLGGVAGRLPDERFGEIEIEMRGEVLDGLDGLLEVALPPLGPYRIQAQLEAFGNGRYASDLTVELGRTSRLEGGAAIDAASTPPRVDVTLAAKTIELDDVDLADWSPFSGADDAESAAAADESFGDVPRVARAIFDPENLRRVDGRLDVKVGRLLSRGENLGAAWIGARLKRGRIALDPFRLEVPAGSVTMTASLAPTHDHTDATFTLVMERFDFGILARRIDPKTKMGGLARLDVGLRSSGASARSLMTHASGHLDFAIFPRDFEAGVIDLWAVNVLPAVVSAVDRAEDESERSQINCIIGLFDLEDGHMQSERLMLDTTRMTVEGHAEVDFETGKVDAELVPTSKRAEFFSLATPVAVDGTISDFDVDVEAGDLIGTVIRFVTSVIHVPLRRLFDDEPPRNELEHCLDGLELRGEPRKRVLGIF